MVAGRRSAGCFTGVACVWVYTVVEKQKFVKPTIEYLQIIKDAAVKWNFPKAYLLEAYVYSTEDKEVEWK